MAEMAEGPRRNAERRRALELLAASPDGCTAAILLAHGFKSDRLVELINAGLASVTTERVVAGDRAMEVTRVRMTDAGTALLAKPRERDKRATETRLGGWACKTRSAPGDRQGVGGASPLR